MPFLLRCRYTRLKPIKMLELHYPMIQFLIIIDIPAARIADPPIYETVWFIALLIVIAVLFIVLLIFELYTRHGAAKYPGKFN